MYLLEIKVKLKKKFINDDMIDVLEEFAGALHRNGNIYGKYIVNRISSDAIVFLARLPEQSSIDKNNLSPWASTKLKEIEKVCSGKIYYKISGDTISDIKKEYNKTENLIMFAHAFSETSQLRSGTNGMPIPFYYLKYDLKILDRLYFWYKEYIHYDNLWLSSGPLEIPIYKQLADVNSDFNKNGLSIAKSISKLTKKRTYYYLQRYWGLKSGEEERVCPNCGSNWYVHSDELKESAGLRWFNFQCHKCFLVSHLGVSYDNNRYAKIGLYR